MTISLESLVDSRDYQRPSVIDEWAQVGHSLSRENAPPGSGSAAPSGLDLIVNSILWTENRHQQNKQLPNHGRQHTTGLHH